MMMRFSVKHGLGLLAGIFLSATAMASEPVPIEDRDAFDKRYVECIRFGLKNDCLISTLSGHFALSVNEIELREINERLKEGLKTAKILNIFPLEKVVRANYFDSRTYLVEYEDEKSYADNSPSRPRIAAAYIVFGRLNKNWYVYSFDIDNSENFVRRLINLPTIIPEK
jgi:hypothetical protein